MNTHNGKIINVKNKHELKGYICRREFPIFRADLKRYDRIDLRCDHHTKPKAPAFVEVEHRSTELQKASNRKKLEIAKETYSESEVCQFNEDFEAECPHMSINRPQSNQQPQPKFKPQFRKPVFLSKPMWWVR